MKIYLILIAIFLISLVSAQCEETYFFILENNYQFNDYDLNESNITIEYIENYSTLCPESISLPKKPENETYILIEDQEECSTEINKVMDFSIPLNFYVGEVSCDKVKYLKYFIQLEETSSYSIVGIKLFPIFFIMFLGLFIWIMKGLIKSEKMMDKFSKV